MRSRKRHRCFRRFTGEAARVSTACLPIMLILTRYGLRVAVRSSARPVTVRPALPQPRPGTRRAGPIDRRVPQPLNDLARTR